MAPKLRFSPKKKTKQSASSTAVPKVASLTPKAAQTIGTSSKTSATAPIELSILQYTECGTDVLHTLPAEPVFQIQVRHEAKPSITQRLIASMQTFLTKIHEEDKTMPSSLATLRTENGILLQITNHEDPAGIGFVPWRIAFYVVGTLQDLQNALTLLDDFVTFRKENTFEHELPFPTLSFQIHTEESIAAALNTAALEHEVTLLKPHRFDPFDAAPPAGLKVLVADGWHLSGVFLGQTYPFKDRFEAAGVYGAREEGTDTYVRVLAKTDVGNETGRTWFFDTLLKEILHNIVMQVRLTTSPPEGSPAAQFLGLLVDLPQISLKQGA